MTEVLQPPAAHAAAIQTIVDEHAALSEVLALLQRTLRDLAGGIGEPDFGLLSLALYYLDDFPGRVHHPKEERVLFPAVRRCAPQFAVTLNRLSEDHASDALRLRDLDRWLVRYQAGAPDALAGLRAAVDVYAATTYEHMRKEERLLKDIGALLPAHEWEGIALVFAEEQEPLLSGHPHGEFGRLRDRIKSRLPARVRFTQTGA